MNCRYCYNYTNTEADCTCCPMSTPFAERNETGEILFFTYEADKNGNYVKHYCTLFELIERLRETAEERRYHAEQTP